MKIYNKGEIIERNYLNPSEYECIVIGVEIISARARIHILVGGSVILYTYFRENGIIQMIRDTYNGYGKILIHLVKKCITDILDLNTNVLDFIINRIENTFELHDYKYTNLFAETRWLLTQTNAKPAHNLISEITN